MILKVDLYIGKYGTLNMFCFQVPAPADLLKFIRCNCKVTSKNPCSSNSCTCRSNGLKCVTACGDCRGYNCSNTEDDESKHDVNDLEDDGIFFERLFDV